MIKTLDPRSEQEVSRLIDHTNLNPAATREDIVKTAEEAAEWGCASVCVHPAWVPRVADVLVGSGIDVCSVVGFPHGASRPQTIAFEADRAVREGAREIDMVIPIGRAIMGEWHSVETCVAVVKAAIGGMVLKTILEVCELDSQQIAKASEVCIGAGADFIKTSTGFGKGGATVESVQLMAEVADGKAGVKAAGGIRTWEDMQRMLLAGATRIGASSTAGILEGARSGLGGA